jgi:hypothetical protein
VSVISVYSRKWFKVIHDVLLTSTISPPPPLTLNPSLLTSVGYSLIPMFPYPSSVSLSVNFSLLSLKKGNWGLWDHHGVWPSICPCPRLITFEPIGRSSWYSAGRSCHWRWPRHHGFTPYLQPFLTVETISVCKCQWDDAVSHVTIRTAHNFVLSRADTATLGPRAGCRPPWVFIRHTQSSEVYIITSWNSRRCSGFKIKWKNSSDMFVTGFWIFATLNLVGIG